MIIQKVELFSTPLTPDYRNVYDDYNSSTDYVNFLKENFLYEVFNRPADSSRKEKNGELDIVLHGLHTDAVRLHDYNYVAIYTTHGGQGDIIKFAFVIDMESVNDTAEVGQNGAIKIRVKMDSWANHYLNIKYDFNSIVENRCTFDTAVWRNYPSKLKENLYSESVEYEGVLPVGINPLDISDHIAVALWNRIYLTGDGKLIGGTIRPSYDIDVKSKHFYDNHPTVYELVGILIYDENKGFVPYHGSYVFSYYDKSVAMVVSSTLSDYFSVKSVKSSGAAACTLTTNVPFNYTLEYDILTETYNLEIGTDSTFYRGNELKVNSIKLVDSDESRELLYLDDCQMVEKYTSLNPSPLASQYSQSLRYSTNFQPEDEQIYHEYPFNYHSIDYGKNSVPIVGAVKKYDSLDLYYCCTQRTIPFVSFTNLNDKTVQFPLSNNQGLPITEVELEEYLARNTGAILNQIVQTVLSSIAIMQSANANMAVGYLTQNVGAMARGSVQMKSIPLNAIGAAASIGLQCFDAYRTPATVRDIDNNAASTWLPSDTISIKKHKAYGIDNYIKDYHYNGYECYYTGSITEKRRDVFDVDCGYAEISSTMAGEDKEELISAFATGVTRWHIGENNADRKAILTAMNKNVLNYPISLIP